ncbi:MAG: hypothetical protein FJX47_15095 [Alphaproteobacteria bacterium]|nr:hypothetical protein [Alphaproteobacteria bacterium]
MKVLPVDKGARWFEIADLCTLGCLSFLAMIGALIDVVLLGLAGRAWRSGEFGCHSGQAAQPREPESRDETCASLDAP